MAHELSSTAAIEYDNLMLQSRDRHCQLALPKFYFDQSLLLSNQRTSSVHPPQPTIHRKPHHNKLWCKEYRFSHVLKDPRI